MEGGRSQLKIIQRPPRLLLWLNVCLTLGPLLPIIVELYYADSENNVLHNEEIQKLTYEVTKQLNDHWYWEASVDRDQINNASSWMTCSILWMNYGLLWMNHGLLWLNHCWPWTQHSSPWSGLSSMNHGFHELYVYLLLSVLPLYLGVLRDAAIWAVFTLQGLILNIPRFIKKHIWMVCVYISVIFALVVFIFFAVVGVQQMIANIAVLLLRDFHVEAQCTHPIRLPGLSSTSGCEVVVMRYNMEDIHFTCSVEIDRNETDGANQIADLFWWEQEGFGRIKATKSDRIVMDFSVKKSGRKTIVKWRLSIQLINDCDYGTYSCHTSLSQNNIQVTAADFITYCKPFVDQPWCRFTLLKIDSLDQVLVAVPPGGIITYEMEYYADVDPEDVVTGVTDRSPENWSCCSFPALLYYFVFSPPHSTIQQSPRKYTDLFGFEHLIVDKWRCLCKEDFIKSNNVFLRTWFNSSTDSQQMFEVEYPLQWVFVPKLPYPWNHFFSDDYDDFVTCWRTRGNESSHSRPSPCSLSTKEINDAVEKAMMTEIFTGVVVLICIVIYCLFLRGIVMWVLIPIKNVILASVGQEQQPEPYQYDLYLSYDDSDRYAVAVARCLREVVERSDFTVFDSCRDILPGRLWSLEKERAITKSHSFAFIISSESDENETILEFIAAKLAAAKSMYTSMKFGMSTPFFFFSNTKPYQCHMEWLLPGGAPCLQLTEGDREQSVLPQNVLDKFSDWAKRRKALKGQTKWISWNWLRCHGFSLKSVLVICALLYFNYVGISFLFFGNEQARNVARYCTSRMILEVFTASKQVNCQ